MVPTTAIQAKRFTPEEDGQAAFWWVEYTYTDAAGTRSASIQVTLGPDATDEQIGTVIAGEYGASAEL